MIVFKDLILFITLIALLLLVYSSIVNGISPTPSSPKQIREIVRAIPSQFSGKIYDLGSGWGTLAFAIARKFPGSKITGLESSLVPYIFSELFLILMRTQHVEFHFANFLQTDFSDADLVVCYLYSAGMEKLKPKLKAQLKPGTIVISNTFAISGWLPAEILQAKDLFHSPIYVYRIQTNES